MNNTKKTVEIEAKVYGITLKSHIGDIFIWVGATYCLDEAIYEAKKDAFSRSKNEDWRLFIYDMVLVSDIDKQLSLRTGIVNDILGINKPQKQNLRPMLPSVKKEMVMRAKEISLDREEINELMKPAPTKTASDVKNEIMKQIIDEKNVELLEVFKKTLTKNDIKLIKVRMKEKNKETTIDNLSPKIKD